MDFVTLRYLVFSGFQGNVKFMHTIDQKKLKKRFENNLLEYIKQFKIPDTHTIDIVKNKFKLTL